jgi:hypothetical protein
MHFDFLAILRYSKYIFFKILKIFVVLGGGIVAFSKVHTKYQVFLIDT